MSLKREVFWGKSDNIEKSSAIYEKDPNALPYEGNGFGRDYFFGDIRGWDVSKIANMCDMFKGCDIDEVV